MGQSATSAEGLQGQNGGTLGRLEFDQDDQLRSHRSGVTGLARITGGLYLAFMVTSVLANVFGHIGMGDAQQIYGAITTNGRSFRLGLVIAFVSAFLFLMTAWGRFVLLRKVNQDLALLFLLLNSVGVAIECASLLQLVSRPARRCRPVRSPRR